MFLRLTPILLFLFTFKRYILQFIKASLRDIIYINVHLLFPFLNKILGFFLAALAVLVILVKDC